MGCFYSNEISELFKKIITCKKIGDKLNAFYVNDSGKVWYIFVTSVEKLFIMMPSK